MANSARVIDSDTLGTLRDLASANLPYACQLQNDVGVDVAGSHRPKWENVGRPVACSLVTFGAGAQAERTNQIQAIGDWVVRFALGVAVTEKQRLIVRGTEGGVTFTRTLMAVKIQGPHSFQVSMRVICRDVTTAEAPG